MLRSTELSGSGQTLPAGDPPFWLGNWAHRKSATTEGSGQREENIFVPQHTPTTWASRPTNQISLCCPGKRESRWHTYQHPCDFSLFFALFMPSSSANPQRYRTLK